jgi:hypothetical protein
LAVLLLPPSAAFSVGAEVWVGMFLVIQGLAQHSTLTTQHLRHTVTAGHVHSLQHSLLLIK